MTEKLIFAMFPKELIHRRAGLTANEMRVYLALALFRNQQTGKCNPFLATISAVTGLDTNEISTITSRLAAKGLIEKRGRGGAGKSVEYVLVATETLALSANPTLADSANPTLALSAKRFKGRNRELNREVEQKEYPARGAGRCDAKAFDAQEMDLPPYVSRDTWIDLCKDKSELGRPIDHGYAMAILGRLRELHKSGNDIDAVIDEMIAGSYKYPRAI